MSVKKKKMALVDWNSKSFPIPFFFIWWMWKRKENRGKVQTFLKKKIESNSMN